MYYLVLAVIDGGVAYVFWKDYPRWSGLWLGLMMVDVIRFLEFAFVS